MKRMTVISRGALVLAAGAAAFVFSLLSACSTPQERSGHNPKPFNRPADWELNPGRDYFRN